MEFDTYTAFRCLCTVPWRILVKKRTTEKHQLHEEAFRGGIDSTETHGRE